MRASAVWLVMMFTLEVVVSRDALGAPISPGIKRTVGFVYVQNDKGDKVPYGTGFFIAIRNPHNEDTYHCYFVTAKHVLRTQDDKSWLPGVFLRLNKKNGTNEYVKIPLLVSGETKTVYTHADPNVDLAVVPLVLKTKAYDIEFLPDHMLTTKADFDQLKICEGSEVFFTGLFTPYTGYDRNYPIVRFGRVALITDEKIEWKKGQKVNLYLIESGSFGGNSGSPVFFNLGLDRERGNIVLGKPIVKIAGVMSGYFGEIVPLQVIQTARIPGVRSSMGISAVVPAYLLHELLFGEELMSARGF